jgi:hypothetical protein
VTKDALQRVPELYRAALSCRIGRDALEGKTTPPPATSQTEYALFNLLHAVEDIAEHLAKGVQGREAKPAPAQSLKMRNNYPACNARCSTAIPNCDRAFVRCTAARPAAQGEGEG